MDSCANLDVTSILQASNRTGCSSSNNPSKFVKDSWARWMSLPWMSFLSSFLVLSSITSALTSASLTPFHQEWKMPFFKQSLNAPSSKPGRYYSISLYTSAGTPSSLGDFLFFIKRTVSSNPFIKKSGQSSASPTLLSPTQTGWQGTVPVQSGLSVRP